MERKTAPVGVCMDVMLQGWYDNGSTTLRSHVSQRRLIQAEGSEIWTPVSELYWQRNAEIFASPTCEQELASGLIKALTRYSEAMGLGDFQH